jgi:hypothetical protein
MPVSTSWMLARAAQMNAGIAFSASSFVFSFHEPVQSLGSRSRCFRVLIQEEVKSLRFVNSPATFSGA